MIVRRRQSGVTDIAMPYTVLSVHNPAAVRRHVAPITTTSAPRQKASMSDIVMHCQTGVMKQLRKVPKRGRTATALRPAR